MLILKVYTHIHALILLILVACTHCRVTSVCCTGDHCDTPWSIYIYLQSISLAFISSSFPDFVPALYSTCIWV